MYCEQEFTKLAEEGLGDESDDGGMGEGDSSHMESCLAVLGLLGELTDKLGPACLQQTAHVIEFVHVRLMFEKLNCVLFSIHFMTDLYEGIIYFEILSLLLYSTRVLML